MCKSGGMHDMLGNLFIVGVQKGGTTALHRFLTEHPSIRGGLKKELHVFDGQDPDTREADVASFQCSFSPGDSQARYRLDATPITCFWPGAIARLHRYNPHARLIMLLRHPAYRAFSNWRMNSFTKVETLPFEVSIAHEDRRRPGESLGTPSRAFSYLQRGRYGHQVLALQSLFPPDQIRFVRTDVLWASQTQVLADLMTWLGLVPVSLPPQRSKYIAPLPSRHLGTADPAIMARLTVNFADDIAETARLTGLDLSDWLSSDYEEAIGP